MPAEQHPRHRLDAVIHAPLRLSIMVCLAGVVEAEFSFVRDTVETTSVNLSKQLTILDEAGYVMIRKGSVGLRPRTWVALTEPGRVSARPRRNPRRAPNRARYAPGSSRGGV